MIWHLATHNAGFAPRTEHTCVAFDNKLWIIGGRTGASSPADDLNDVWYSSDGVTWTQATASAAFAPRWYHSSIVHDGKMWVIGGRSFEDIWSSTDGVTWFQESTGPGWDWMSGHQTVFFKQFD